mgnify:CR=1 FL=1
MPRRARLAVAGIPWHIIQRGNNRSACFYAEADYHLYLQDLGEQSGKFGCQVHAYCLMTNHVHLLVTPERVESAGLIDEIRQATNGNYVLGDERFNREIELMLQRRVTPGKAGRPVKDGQ